MNPQLVDRIYESALMPEFWPSLLGELAHIAGARTGFFLISNGHVHDYAASNEIGNETLKPLVASGYITRSERFRRLLAMQHPGFLREHDIYTSEELATDPFYRDVLYPRGLGWATATAILLPTGNAFSICLEREYSRGPAGESAIQTLDELRPHLARSALLSARLQLGRAQIMSQTLAAIGLPALVLDGDGKVLAANTLIEAMTGYIQWRPFDRVSLKDRSADKLLREAIVAGQLEEPSGVLSFPTCDLKSETRMVAHVIPIRRSARDIFVQCAAALILTPVTLPRAPPISIMQSLFDLTAAEARVARALASGETVDDIAIASGVSSNTIRTHVRGVLEKTGCRRQSNMVALLTGIWSPPTPDTI